MTNGIGPGRDEYQGTYVVLNRNSQEELRRLAIQDQMITTAMRGVLPEQSHPETLRRVLDIGCGPGNWLIEAAKTYPEIEKLIGIDVSRPMIKYAREQASVQRVAERVEFHVMDALLVLEFPYNFFDLINLRFGVSFLRTWDWTKLLSEMQRVSLPGGVIRITDANLINRSNSPALTQHFESWIHVLFRAGHLFEEQADGLTAHLPELLTRHGIQQVQARDYALQFRAGTPEGLAYAEDMQYAFRTGRPFLERRGGLPKDHETVYQQALTEMHRPDFCATMNLLTVWGNTPGERLE